MFTTKFTAPADTPIALVFSDVVVFVPAGESYEFRSFDCGINRLKIRKVTSFDYKSVCVVPKLKKIRL